MSGKDFTAWVDRMKATRGWSGRQCAIELGCDKNRIAVYKAGGAPKYIALACAALANDLAPFTAAVHDPSASE
jgi:hypothetical protein